jgi:hypothetical protein
VTTNSSSSVEIQTDGNSKAVAQGRCEKSGTRGRADQRELSEINANRACRRPLTDNEVELEVLHRRIEDLFNRRVEAMDFINKEHVALFEVGQKCCEITGLGNYRTGRRAKADAQFLGHNLRKRRLAKTRRPRKQHMIQRIAARFGRLNEDAQVRARLLLPDKFGKRLRPDGRLESVRFAFGRGYEPVGHVFWALAENEIR